MKCLEEQNETVHPLDIVRAVYLPGRKIYGFIISMRNVPGALAKTSKVFWKNGINILYCIGVSKEEISDNLLICDFTFSRVVPKEILQQIREVEDVIEVTIIEPIMPGFVIDYVHFPILLAGKRCLIIRQELMREIMNGVREEWGSAGNVFLYHMGKRAGALLWKTHSHFTERTEETIRILEAIMKSTGLGEFKFEMNANGSLFKVIVKYSFECENQKQETENGQSQFIRGLIAGIIGELLGKNVEVKETKCIARGDPYCEFIVINSGD